MHLLALQLVAFIQERYDFHARVRKFPRGNTAAKNQFCLNTQLLQRHERLKGNRAPFSLPIRAQEKQPTSIRFLPSLYNLARGKMSGISAKGGYYDFPLIRMLVINRGIS